MCPSGTPFLFIHTMKRLLLSLIYLCCIAHTPLCAQESMTVTNFEADPSDLSAQVHQVMDMNGDPCALIKVSAKGEDVAFEGDIIKWESKGGNEYWVYVINAASWIAIKSSSWNAVVRYDFPLKIEKLRCYILNIGSQMEVAVSLMEEKMRLMEAMIDSLKQQQETPRQSSDDLEQDATALQEVSITGIHPQKRGANTIPSQEGISNEGYSQEKADKVYTGYDVDERPQFMEQSASAFIANIEKRINENPDVIRYCSSIRKEGIHVVLIIHQDRSVSAEEILISDKAAHAAIDKIIKSMKVKKAATIDGKEVSMKWNVGFRIRLNTDVNSKAKYYYDFMRRYKKP